MKTILHTLNAKGSRVFKYALVLALICYSTIAHAAHFRSGTISWRPISGNTVEFKVSQSYGGWAFGGGYTLGSTQIMDNLYLGNGASVPIPLVITSINAAEGWWYGEATFRYTYPSAGNYIAYFSSCCRISNLSNNNDQAWRNETVVNVGTGNSSPVSTIAATVNLPTSLQSATFQIPAFDPDGDQLSYRLATSAEMGGGTNPTGLSINATTGEVSFNTVGKPIGSLWNVAFTISDGTGKTKVTVDFIIKITQNSTPPVFDYLVTPTNGRVFQGAPGQTISFPVRAYDNDPGNVVTLSAVGLPPGSTTSPSLPSNGNPVSSTFSWTPTASQFGTFVVNFTATDNIGVQTTTSVTISISLKPVFVAPSPANNSETYLETGETYTATIRASDPDPNDVVRITAVSGMPAGYTISSGLPTAAANPVNLNLSWTPTPSAFGPKTVTFTATDSYGDQTTHTLNYIVNTKPQFTSTPTTSVYVGQLYSYTITGLDPDVQYGDVLKLIGGNIPSWLTLTNNGNGTGTLSGTPSMANIGTHPVSLKLEDTYHHDYNPNTAQNFDINVSGVAPSIVVPANIISCDPVVTFAASETVGIPASTITYSIAPGSTFPVGTTTVTATATNAVGTSTNTFTVTVNKPIADITALGATTFCEGSNVTLSAAQNALQLNGSQYVNVSNGFATTDDITIEATITPTATAGGDFKVIMNHNSWYSGTIHFQFAPDGRLQFALNGANPTDQYSTYNFVPNTTYRIATVYSKSGKFVKFYVNGVLVNTASYSTTVSVVGNAGYNIGAWNGNSRYFRGTIDDLRIWNVQRTNAEVLSDAAALPIPSGTPNLVRYYKFNEGFGTSTADAAGNGNGTLINNPTWVSTAPAGQTYLWSNSAITPSISATADGSYTVTVTDAAGCTVTSSPINVIVNKAPVFTVCASNQTADNAVGLNSAVVTYTATATGSPAAALSYTFSGATTGSGSGTGSGSIFNIGTTTVTITATNSCGSTTCTFTVKVNDITPPTINTVTDINAIATSAAGTIVTYTAPVGTDNMPGSTTTQTSGLASGSVFPIGTTVNTFVVTDASGLTATSSFTVTVVGVAPSIVVPTTIRVDASTANCGAVVNFAASEITGIPASTITYSHQPGSAFSLGTTIVTATATNAVGTSSATFEVVVTDNTAPVITTPAAQVFCENTAGTYTLQDVSATDNCGIATVSFAITGATTRSGSGYDAGTAFAVGTSTITYTVTDVNGNVSTKTLVVTVNKAPTATISTSNPDAFCNKLTVIGNSTSPINGYAWTYNNNPFAGTQAISLDNTNGDGTYSLLVTDNKGCTSLAAVTYQYSKQNTISNYTILAYKEAELKEYNTVQTGSVGVMSKKGEAEIGKNSSVAAPGAFVKAPKIEVKQGATVPIRLVGVASVALPTMQYNSANTSSLPNYTTNAGATISLSGNYKNLKIRKGSNVTLSGTTFGNIDIEEGSVVRFTSTVINVEQLKVGKGPDNGLTQVRFANNTSVRVSKHVQIDEDCFINPDANQVTFYLGRQSNHDCNKHKNNDSDDDDHDRGHGDGDQKFEVKGGNTTVIANIYAPTGDIKVKGGEGCHKNHINTTVRMTGLFIGYEVEGEGKNVIWNNYACGSSSPIAAADAQPVYNKTSEPVEVANDLKVTVMPNPSTTYFTLKLASKSELPVNIKVVDAAGRVIDAKAKQPANSTMQMGQSYVPGSYFAEFIQGNQRKVVQLIKLK